MRHKALKMTLVEGFEIAHHASPWLCLQILSSSLDQIAKHYEFSYGS